MIPFPDYTPDEILQFLHFVVTFCIIIVILIILNLSVKLLLNLHLLIYNFKKYILKSQNYRNLENNIQDVPGFEI